LVYLEAWSWTYVFGTGSGGMWAGGAGIDIPYENDGILMLTSAGRALRGMLAMEEGGRFL